MRTPREIILDTYSALSHKLPLRDDTEAKVKSWQPDTWMGEEHRRRLAAYTVTAAYEANIAREFLDTDSDDDRSARREYGDAALIVNQTLSAVLGDDQQVIVPGAERYDPELDEPPADGETRDDKVVAENARARVLADVQDRLREWADDVHLQLRMVDTEREAVRDGDGVYLLGWDPDNERPTCVGINPGFYFPVLPDSLDSYAYPEKVHFAWELPGEDFDDGKPRIRRITYELRDMEPEYVDDGTGDPAMVIPDGAKWEAARPTDPNAETFDRLVRAYPWNTKPSTKACYMTDATWRLDDLNDARNVDAFDLDGNFVSFQVDADGNELRDVDLGIDFVPVVHIPNTPPGGDHFGRSSLAVVAQLLDDIQAADTDAAGASALAGAPLIGISGNATMGDNLLTGKRGQQVEVVPGLVLRLGENGRMDVLDLASNLTALRDYVKDLRDRLAVNSQLPPALLGTVKPSEVPSGIALQLSFGPLSSMVRTMRLVRHVKYPLLLKFVLRLYQANGVLTDVGDLPRAEIQFGAFLPTDQDAVLKRVVDAYGAKLISLDTAVTMLLEAGFPVDDVAEEILRIEARDFDGANRLVDMTGDPEDGRKYLQLDPAPTAEGQPIAGGAGAGAPSPSDSGAGA